MYQESKNVMYTNSTSAPIDSMYSEIFENTNIHLQVKNRIKFFFETVLPIYTNMTKTKLLEFKKKSPLTSSSKDLYLSHYISGGGGMLFRYKKMILKIVPSPTLITSMKDVNECWIPKYLSKLLFINDYKKISEFVFVPLYIKYGNIQHALEVLQNMYYLSLMVIAMDKVNELKQRITPETISEAIDGLNRKDLSNISKTTMVNLSILSDIMNTKILIINNIYSMRHVINRTSYPYGYVMLSYSAIISCNNLNEKFLESYSSTPKQMLKKLSLQLIIQLLVFYHTLLKMKPNYSHNDLKIDNILLRELPSHKITEKIIVNDTPMILEINSPLIFMINDFDKAIIDDGIKWMNDFKMLVYSINYYKNLIIPEEILIKLNDPSIDYTTLITLITDKTFKDFIKHDVR